MGTRLDSRCVVLCLSRGSFVDSRDGSLAMSKTISRGYDIYDKALFGK